MTDLPHEELLTGYLDGELSAEESELVERLLRTSAEARQLLEELRALRDTIRALPRYALGAGLPSDTFAQRVLQRAERALLVPDTAEATVTEDELPAEDQPLADEEAAPQSSTAASRASEVAAEAAETEKPHQSPDVATFNGGAGWKRLLAAAAVLAAAVTLMVLGPAQRGPVETTVALQSDRASEADAVGTTSELANTGMVELAPQATDGAGIAAFNPFATPPEIADSAAPGMPAPMAMPATPLRDGLEVEGITRRPAAADRLGMRLPEQGPSTFSAADERLQITGGTPLVTAGDAATAGAGETPRSRLAGPSLVVHVQLTEDAWQEGRFARLLSRRQIAWQDSTPANERAARAESAAGNQRQLAEMNLHLVQASAPVASMQSLLGDLETAAAQGSGVVALAVAAPDAASYRDDGSLAIGGIASEASETFSRYHVGPGADKPARRMDAAPRGGGMRHRSDRTGPDEVAPWFSPLDSQPKREADTLQRPDLPVRPQQSAQQDRQAIADTEAAGPESAAAPVERQLGRAIRLETTVPETLARERRAAPAFAPAMEAFRSEAAPADSPRPSPRDTDGVAAAPTPQPAEPLTASVKQDAPEAKQDAAQAKQDAAEADAAGAASEAVPKTEALFIIQIVPSPAK